METFQALQVPASSFDFPELLKGTRQTLSSVEEELRNVAKFWNVAESMILQVEGYRGLLWEKVDGVEIEISVKAMQKSLQRDVKVRSAHHYGLMLGKVLRLHLVKRVCTSYSYEMILQRLELILESLGVSVDGQEKRCVPGIGCDA